MSSLPNETTVLIFVTASIIRLPESLYASSVRSENPYKNYAYKTPPKNAKGDNANIIRVRAQLASKAITRPQIIDPIF